MSLDLENQIRHRAVELGFDGCAFTSCDNPGTFPHFQQWLNSGMHAGMGWMARNTEKRAAPSNLLPGAKSCITLLSSYYVPPSPPETQNTSGMSGRIARYACFDDYHDVLAERLKLLVTYMQGLGSSTAQFACHVDTGPVLERDLAQRAGLGFIGKHTNLISRLHGNWVFLSEIFATLELKPDKPEKNRCGSCDRCIKACPTSAIVHPFILDARRCISYHTIENKGSIPTEIRPLMGNRIFGCDDCLDACPWNRFAQAGKLMRPHQRDGLNTLDLIELLAMDEVQFKARFAGTPLYRSRRRGLLRNVCVALGNSLDVSAIPALEKAAHDAEPLIQEHAIWAVEHIRKSR